MITALDQDEWLIELTDDAPDSFGRRTFFAYWLADNAGPACNEHGIRGQAFFTDPEVFVDRCRARGRIVRYVESGDPR